MLAITNLIRWNDLRVSSPTKTSANSPLGSSACIERNAKPKCSPSLDARLGVRAGFPPLRSFVFLFLVLFFGPEPTILHLRDHIGREGGWNPQKEEGKNRKRDEANNYEC